MVEEFVLVPYVDKIDPTTDADGNQIQFKFDELPAKVQDTLVEKHRYSYISYEDSLCSKEDITACALCLGINIAETIRKSSTGHVYIEYGIEYSYSCSQDDGARITGSLRTSELHDAVAKVTAHAPQDRELINLAEQAEAIYQALTVKIIQHKLIGEDDEIDSDNWLTAWADIGSSSLRYQSVILNESEEWGEDIEAQMDALISGFTDWIYAQIEREYNYYTSDGFVREDLLQREQLYDETGEEV